MHTCPAPRPLRQPAAWTAFEANASLHEPSGNLAMLALAANSNADWVPLPASNIPQPDSEVQQTAWGVERALVRAALGMGGGEWERGGGGEMQEVGRSWEMPCMARPAQRGA